MAALTPPEGMTEDDYDAIHAAVVETVRGRWFLTEFQRRGRLEEVQQMLAAIGRLEAIVTTGRAAMPSAGEAAPHTRLLTQRVDEISTHLADIIEELRASGADAYLCDDLEREARAVTGLTKMMPAEPAPAAPQALAAAPKAIIQAPKEPSQEPQPALQHAPKPAPLPPWTPPAPPAPPRMASPASPPPQASPASLHAAPLAPPSAPPPGLPRATPLQIPAVAPGEDPRRQALAALDRLPLAEKLALFS